MSDNNPYTAPGAELARESVTDFTLTGPKSTSPGRGWDWIVDGFQHVRKNPLAWVFTLIIFIIVLIVMSMIPIIGQIATMATYYVWQAGFLLGCREQDRGGSFRVEHLFAGFRNPGKLITLSVLISAVGTLIMILFVGPIYLEFLKGGDPSPELIAAMSDPRGFWLPLAFGMLAMIPVMMAAWFAPALIALNDVSVVEALKLSFAGTVKNIVPFTLYGLIAFVLYILGAIPLLLGLLLVLPALLASVYTSYKDIFIN